jgi:hypothetical protein
MDATEKRTQKIEAKRKPVVFKALLASVTTITMQLGLRQHADYDVKGLSGGAHRSAGRKRRMGRLDAAQMPQTMRDQRGRAEVCHRGIIRAPPVSPFPLPAGCSALLLAIRCAVAASIRFIGILTPYLCKIRDVVCPSGSVMKLIWASL